MGQVKVEDRAGGTPLPARLFVYGSLRSGGRMSRYLSGERRLATLWGWSLYGYGPSRAQILYPLAVRGGAADAAPVVGEVVEINWADPAVAEVVRIERQAGYVATLVTVQVDGSWVEAVAFEWQRQDDDWIQDRIESGDWLTFTEVGR